ncbi:MAG TPA: YkgJ family cysteine cluster protein [Anaeromyxobacteraceae bacterium]|nr:YkgJ family cysteine cluster protein [Anaeromyxobacteraceae bacterium]
MDLARVEACGRDVGRMVAQTLEHGRADEGAFVALSAAIERRIGVELDSAHARASPAPACAPGCASCCTVNVATLPVEGAAIAAWLRRRLTAGEVSERAAALLAFHARVRWSDDAERIRERLACPFLDRRGECAVHPVRPLACRGVSSLDAGDCRRALAERAGDEGDGCVRMNVLQRALHDEALREVAAALAERGLDARSRDVSGMAGAFLADPARVRDYLAGVRLPLE